MTDHYVYGVHAVKAVLANPQRKIDKIYLNSERTDEKIKQIETLARQQSIRIEKLSTKEMNQRFAEVTHQGVLAEVKPLPPSSFWME